MKQPCFYSFIVFNNSVSTPTPKWHLTKLQSFTVTFCWRTVTFSFNLNYKKSILGHIQNKVMKIKERHPGKKVFSRTGSEWAENKWLTSITKMLEKKTVIQKWWSGKKSILSKIGAYISYPIQHISSILLFFLYHDG